MDVQPATDERCPFEGGYYHSAGWCPHCLRTRLDAEIAARKAAEAMLRDVVGMAAFGVQFDGDGLKKLNAARALLEKHADGQ